MSRIDHALRQASGTAAAPIEMPPGLAGYATEDGPPRPTPAATRASPPAAAASDARSSTALRALTASLYADPLLREQYLRLAASLEDAAAAQGLKTIIVSSAVPREGKTLTVANLAVTLATSYGQRVVAIDADLRRPSLHELFALRNDSGLADWLEAPGQPLPLVELSPSLAVIPAGRAVNPTASLASDGLKQLTDRLAGMFDWILVDTSPVMISEGQMVARHGEGVILVVGAGVTPYRLVQRAIATIGRERVLGTVLNRASRQFVPAGGYYACYYDEAGTPTRRE